MRIARLGAINFNRFRRIKILHATKKSFSSRKCRMEVDRLYSFEIIDSYFASRKEKKEIRERERLLEVERFTREKEEKRQKRKENRTRNFYTFLGGFLCSFVVVVYFEILNRQSKNEVERTARKIQSYTTQELLILRKRQKDAEKRELRKRGILEEKKKTFSIFRPIERRWNHLIRRIGDSIEKRKQRMFLLRFWRRKSEKK